MIYPTEAEIKECSPYNDQEFCEALERVLAHPVLPKLVSSFFSNQSLSDFLKSTREIKSIDKFQAQIISQAVASILNQTSSGLTVGGIQNLSKTRKYLFISNHRDIICDSAFLTDSLYHHGFTTPKICLGDNLLVNPLTTDLLKMNKGIIVKRNLPIRHLFKWSIALSEIIRAQIEKSIDSVWIAQREGRAKDGNDHTHPGVIKMLSLTGEGPISKRILDLHIVPVAISYEYDPCDLFKARELFIRESTGDYQKSPSEDLTSMTTGITGTKGRVHIEIGSELVRLPEPLTDNSRNSLASSIAQEIDLRIHRLYRNWPTNFIASDLLESQNRWKDRYTEAEKDAFIERMERRLSELKLEEKEISGIRHFFLKIYSNSVSAAEE